MKKAAAKKAPDDPVSVILPAQLRRRIELEARKRGLKLSPTIRLLVSERVDELEGREELDQALEWQRAQAWATWERIKGGETDDVGFESLEAEFDTVLGAARRAR